MSGGLRWTEEQLNGFLDRQKSDPYPPRIVRRVVETNGKYPYEEVEQRLFAQFLDLKFSGQWFHVPNGGHRNKVVGGKLKAQGVKKGVPDNFIVRPLKGAPGVVVELKRIKGGTLSKEQKIWIETLRGFGWIIGVCSGAVEAIKFVRGEYGI